MRRELSLQAIDFKPIFETKSYDDVTATRGRGAVTREKNA
jgi:hypothetical protein